MMDTVAASQVLFVAATIVSSLEPTITLRMTAVRDQVPPVSLTPSALVESDNKSLDGKHGENGQPALPLGVELWAPKVDLDSVLETSVAHLHSTPERIRQDPVRLSAMISSHKLNIY